MRLGLTLLGLDFPFFFRDPSPLGSRDGSGLLLQLAHPLRLGCSVRSGELSRGLDSNLS